MTPQPEKSGQPARTSTSAPAYARVSSVYLLVLVGLFVGVMLISNISATAPVVFFPNLSFHALGVHVSGINTDGAFFLFPLAYVLGDVISEVYGFRVMRVVIAIGFGALVLAAASFWLTSQLPSPADWPNGEAFATVAVAVPRFLLAGLAGYLVGEFLNSYVLVKMKQRSGERRLWARLLGSTVVGEFADTLVFCAIAAPALGFTSAADFWNYTILGFVWKTAVEIVIMPLSYATCRWLKHREPSYQEALAMAKSG